MKKQSVSYKVDFCDGTSTKNYISHDTILETNNLDEAIEKFNSLESPENEADFYELIKLVDGEITEWNHTDIDVMKINGNHHIKTETFWLTT